MGPDAIARLTDFTLAHRARLVKPLIGYQGDSSLVLFFVPAAGEGLDKVSGAGQTDGEDHDGGYTFHHLRRDLFDVCVATGMRVRDRGMLETADVCITRLVVDDDVFRAREIGEPGLRLDAEKLVQFVASLEKINCWLREMYWPSEDGILPGGEWVVGQEVGLALRSGTIWFGGGEVVADGKGFQKALERLRPVPSHILNRNQNPGSIAIGK
jgi:hypothetical protein